VYEGLCGEKKEVQMYVESRRDRSEINTQQLSE
jgi:hypothetical protein